MGPRAAPNPGSFQQPVPVWPMPQGAVPGAPAFESAHDKKIRTLGQVAFVLSLVELAYCAYRMFSSAVMGPLMRWYFESLLGRSGMRKVPFLEGMGDFMTKIAIAEVVRSVPFVVASVVLLRISLRLKRAEPAALDDARKWLFWALGAIAVSILVQAVVTLPATMEWQEKFVAAMPAMPPPGTRGAPPFDMKQMITMMTMASSLVGLLFGSVMMAVFPVVVYVWAGKLKEPG
jgi:hypothetical protein